MKIIGLSDRMAPGWLEEFCGACDTLGLKHRIITSGCNDWMNQVQGTDAFIWRPIMADPTNMADVRTKIPLLESMGIHCFPNSLMLWLYDDKIRESYFLRQHGYPMPSTFITFDEHEARSFIKQATYPLVTKTHMGASSSGVMLLPSVQEAEHLLNRVFAKQSVLDKALAKYYYIPRLTKGDFFLARQFRYRDNLPKYMYFQEFVVADGDWRITTLGRDLISVFVRRNRPDDFRASGSGLWEQVSEDTLPTEACDLALSISNRHGFTSMTYDFMKGPQGWCIGEISFTFMLNSIYSDTLFRCVDGVYHKVASIPIGVMHLNALHGMIDHGGARRAQGTWL